MEENQDFFDFWPRNREKVRIFGLNLNPKKHRKIDTFW